ncbi:MAG: TonB-dependent receptor [Acidobacteria bacterium]|nr:TonB-dependent receptor [Acidobacteriota bacterium]
MRQRILGLAAAALAWLVLLPAVAHAQSAIVGVVKDTSGAVLPGVTVEAASDALIEKTRSVVTDGNGQYRIVDLRPGVYSVTFALEGFQSFKRDGLELPAQFTMTINADMKVGALEETLTVTGDAPTVDVQTAVHTQVLNREAIDAIPTGRTIQGMGQLIVGVSLNLPDTGGARAMQQTYMSTHGMSTANNTIMIDGMIVNGLQSDGAVQSYFNDAMNQEVSYQTSGIGAETSSGGVRLNMIPREGGNRFNGDFKTAYRPHQWQGSNLTDRLVAQNLKTGNGIDRIIDATVAQGGPIKKDKVWFFVSARYFSVNNFIADTQFKDGSRGVDDQFIRSALARVTWQVTPKWKFGAYQDEIDKYRGHDMQSKYEPETAAIQWFSPAYHTNQAKLTGTLTPRLLVEGGFSSNLEYYTNSYRPGVEQPRWTDAWYATTGMSEADLGGLKRAATGQNTQSPARYNWQTSISYVTGAHNLKTGIQYQRGTFSHTVDANGDLYQVYRSSATGIPYTRPDTVVIRNTPLARYGERLNYDVGIFVQDTFTMKRLTMTAGIRYEWLEASVMASKSPAGRFVPARSFDEVPAVPKWHDPAPRFSAVYDVFGNAKTALKYSLNRYNQARTTGIASLYNPFQSQTAALAWTDVNGDNIAQGQLYNADGSRAPACTYPSVGCEINFNSLPSNFGVASPNEYGAYPRTWNLEQGVEIQHELLPRLSLTGSWFTGQFHNLTRTINQSWLYTGSDPTQNPNYTPMTIYNAVTGQPITVYARTAAAQALPTRNLDTNDPDRKRTYNAFNLEFRARLGRGSQLFGGFAFERQLETICAAADNPNALLFCDDTQNDIPFSKQFKIAGNYPLPYGIQLSGSFQSNQGPSGTAGSPTTSQYMAITRGVTRYPSNCPAPCPAGSVILPSTFQPATLSVPLIAPAAYFNERINQLDLKVSKTFKVTRFTVTPQFEMFNVNNSDAIISYVTNNVLSSSYRYANSVMQPRMLGVGAQVKW